MSCKDKQTSISFLLAIKQLLVSLCKSCLEGSLTVEAVIQIFADVQVGVQHRYTLLIELLQEMAQPNGIVADLLADILATLGLWSLCMVEHESLICPIGIRYRIISSWRWQCFEGNVQTTLLSFD
jgi:hypothetical protein